MNVAPCLMAFMLIAVSAPQQALAKETHVHHGTRKAVPVSPKGAPAEGAVVKGVTPDKRQEVGVRPKAAAPAISQARRALVPAPSSAIPRNAIGQPVVPREVLTGSSEKPAGPSSPTARAALGATGTPANPYFASSNPGQQNLHPTVAINPIGRGKIDGAGPIRPPPAPSGLGGPAKVAAGINGTTWHQKR
jgi:hypothetical protein